METCMEKRIYPFVAIVGQEKMKTGLLLNIVNPSISGILIRGEKGTAKSTAVRALADLLPTIQVVEGCPFQCAPDDMDHLCSLCRERIAAGERLAVRTRKVRVVELPLSATEDRVVGTLNLEHALKEGEKKIEPGLLAAAHRGILYVDEVNLLDDHVVDVLLDSAAMGVNTVEREGISFSHQAHFTLVGTMNPEEGELRPQLQDRFGLCVQIEGIRDAGQRVEIIKRRAAFEKDPEAFAHRFERESRDTAESVSLAISKLNTVEENDDILYAVAKRAVEAGVDGHRGDIVMLKAAKALTALDGRDRMTMEDVVRAAELVLPHRMRRLPFEELGRPEKRP
jgi:magnesium chelatase subunit I